MFLVFLLIVVGIGKYFIDIVVKEETDIDRQGANLVTVTSKKELSWGELAQMIENCEVVQVSQTHDLRVGVVTKDERIFWAYEPQIDDILDFAEKASNDCDMDILMVTE